MMIPVKSILKKCLRPAPVVPRGWDFSRLSSQLSQHFWSFEAEGSSVSNTVGDKRRGKKTSGIFRAELQGVLSQNTAVLTVTVTEQCAVRTKCHRKACFRESGTTQERLKHFAHSHLQCHVRETACFCGVGINNVEMCFQYFCFSTKAKARLPKKPEKHLFHITESETRRPHTVVFGQNLLVWRCNM